MKKTIIILMLTAMTATSAFARDITVSFADGTTHQYRNTPDHVTPIQIQDRANNDFPTKTLVQIDGGKTNQAGMPATAPESTWCKSGAGLAACWAVGIVLVVGIVMLLPVMSAAAGCQHDSDRAKDGSRCGGRSADSRPGGN